MTGQPLERRTIWSYSAGAIGTGVFTTVPGLLLLYFLTNTLAVPAAVASVVLFAPKAWDAVLNPYVGVRSDRRAGSRGRSPFLLAGAIATPLLFVLLFATPDLGSPGAQAAWVGVAFVAAMTGFALFQVPWIVLPAELTDDYHERTRLMSVRMVLLTVGILVGGAVAPLIAGGKHGSRGGYAVMGLVVGAIVAAAMFTAWWGTRNAATRPQSTTADGHPPIRAQLAAVRRNPPFAALLCGYLLQSIAVGAMLAATPYVATYVLGDNSLSSVLFVCLVGPAAVCVPLWRRLSRRTGKLPGYVAATVVFAVVAATLVACRSESHLLVFAQMAGLGIGYAGMQLFPYAMLPDAVAQDRERSGEIRGGLLTGVWQAGETIGLAVGPGLYALVLAGSGFVSGSADHRVPQPSSAITGLVLGFSILPAVFVVASLPLLRRYASVDSAAGAAAGPLLPLPISEKVS